MSDYILYEKDGAIAYLTFNKPEKGNCISGQDDWNDMHAKWKMAEDDEEVKVIIWRGKGSHFCSGADLNLLGTRYYDQGRKTTQRHYLRYDRMLMERERDFMQSTKVMIAQVQGYAMGGGMRIAMYCDLVVAAENVTFGYPEARMIGPYAPCLPLFWMKLGATLAMETMLTGRAISAQEMLAARAISRVVPLENLEEETMKLATAVTLGPADGLYIGKIAINMMYENMGFGEALSWGYVMHTLQLQQRLGPGEWNIFKARQAGGVREVIRTRDGRYGDLVPNTYKGPKVTE